MRVCFLGNSHIACVREAYRSDPGRWPVLQAQFVGAHGTLLLETDHSGGRLVPATDAARAAFRRLSRIDAVDLGAFDAFVVTGCLVSVATAANIYRDARWVGLPSLLSRPDIAVTPPTLVSRAAARAAMAANFATRLGPALVRHLATGTDRPILLTSQPRVSADIKRRRRPVVRAHHTALANGDAQGLSEIYEAAARAALTDAGATYLPQPSHTIEDAILTALPFMNGATRLTAKPGTPQPEDDIMHANARYGAALLDQVAATLDP